MALIKDEDKEYLKKKFDEEMEGEVKIIYFTQDFECQFCKETREILEELAQLNDKIKLEVHEFDKEKELAEKYDVDKIPATLIFGEKEYGIRFFGIPSGYEFSTLVEDIIHASRGETELNEEIKEEIRKIDKPVHIQVFVTPTCPYCPISVNLAHQMAIENENIRADMVEAIEFPHLSQKYDVMGVPKTVINDKREVVGAVPQEMLLEEIKKALEE
ncbi:MAG TPA: glutaredoxin [Thermoplasmatales archaeon]|jgi:glutaredoxin-like protein|nr:thioredoxin family protein [Thermoplasmata archaeon]HHO57357.1 glutaredoxin [Thermoplasmatales archaeon]